MDERIGFGLYLYCNHFEIGTNKLYISMKA